MTEGPLILASGSPRRRKLLGILGMRFTVVPSEADETPAPGEDPVSYATRAARDKALDVAKRHPGRLVLGADTVVEIDSEILGKPTSAGDAAEMLKRLSGRSHMVHTAVALAANGEINETVDSARVEFVDLDEEKISWYVATGEAMDKAGAYAVQGIGGLLVARVDGSPNTVIGLPVHRLPELFASHGIDFWRMLKTV